MKLYEVVYANISIVHSEGSGTPSILFKQTRIQVAPELHHHRHHLDVAACGCIKSLYPHENEE